jgi:uncharacterized protein involved in high-affinity Fe2+ transport
MKQLRFACASVAFLLVIDAAIPCPTLALEVPIGKPKTLHSLRIAAVYSEAIAMDEYWGGPPPGEADIHLEADIHAIKGNQYGFRAGEWISYLSINYTLELLGTDKKLSGQLWQMMAKDGPHYGLNLKMLGPGRYRLTYRIGSPSEWGLSRHTDRESGVDPWWEPFEVEWTFQYPAAEKRR